MKKNLPNSTTKKLILEYMTAYTNKEYSRAEQLLYDIRELTKDRGDSTDEGTTV